MSQDTVIRIQPEKQNPYLTYLKQREFNSWELVTLKDELNSPKKRWLSNPEISKSRKLLPFLNWGGQRNQGYQSSGTRPPGALLGRSRD